MKRADGAIRNQNGQVLILVVIAFIALLAFAALALDVGNLMVVRNELQNIADGAALAGARTLGRLYECDGNIVTCLQPMPYQEQSTYVADAAVIKQACIDVASENKAGDMTGITIIDAEIVIGNWDPSTKTLNATLISPDAVRVTARRDASANGPISTFFARILGIDTMNVSAIATAALTSESTIEPGKLSPIGIDETWFENKEVFCDQNIKFYPTNSPEGCAGWNVFYGTQVSDDGDACQGAGHANPECLRTRILEPWLNDPNYKSPGADTGDIFEFTGGTLGNNTFEAFYNLWDFMRTHDDDNLDDRWTTSVVVYENANCENPEGARTIKGFATVEIFDVVPPNVEITAKVKCDMTQMGRGGGGTYGTKGSIPGLVQ